MSFHETTLAISPISRAGFRVIEEPICDNTFAVKGIGEALIDLSPSFAKPLVWWAFPSDRDKLLQKQRQFRIQFYGKRLVSLDYQLIDGDHMDAWLR